MTFKAGQSGNPAGRPKGARNRTTLAIEALLDGEAEELARKVIEKAREGDMTALKLRAHYSRLLRQQLRCGLNGLHALLMPGFLPLSIRNKPTWASPSAHANTCRCGDGVSCACSM